MTARTFTFTPAKRENVPLIIGLAGGTGSGKSMSAYRLATGLSGGKRFCVIDTENGRANLYADAFAFDHGDLRAPFTPMAYEAALDAADKAGYPVIVIDSGSHEWAGDGGILDMQEGELDRMAGDDWKKREAVKMASWIRPKLAHKRLVQRMLQVRAHLIICFRAEAKIEMVKGANGRMEVRPKQTLTSLDGWIPICEKNLPYELTLSALLLAENPGVPVWIKLQQQHKAFFPAGEVLTETAGQKLAEWAAGGAVQTVEKPGARNDVLVERITRAVHAFTDARALGEWWNSAEEKAARRAELVVEDQQLLKQLVTQRIAELKTAKVDVPAEEIFEAENRALDAELGEPR